MELLPIFLVISSTAMHAGWNLLARRRREESVFMGRMLIVITLVGCVPATISEAITRSLTPLAWWCLLGSGVCCGIYYHGLAKAYGAADFTTVYPVTRATPVILLALVDVLRARNPTGAGFAGMGAVAVGCLLTPLSTFRDCSVRHYFNRASLWMLLAASGTAGYSLLDKIGAESVASGPATAARYGYFFYVVSGITLLLLTPRRRPVKQPASAVGWGGPAAGAALNFASYWLILWAYQLTERVSYIVAFRQFSIVIGVVLAFILFREKGIAVRLTGALLITAGLVVIGAWGR